VDATTVSDVVPGSVLVNERRELAEITIIVAEPVLLAILHRVADIRPAVSVHVHIVLEDRVREDSARVQYYFGCKLI
jgi:hypothetical protein